MLTPHDKHTSQSPVDLFSHRLHVAIIMDGSGRWAVARGLPRAEGHRAGRALRCAARCRRSSMAFALLTLFTFSTDNWGRPEDEVVELMRTFEDFFRVDAPALATQGVRVSVIGRRDRLPSRPARRHREG